MPFKKIKRGKGRGKYRSPSGRTYTKKQVGLYYHLGGRFPGQKRKRKRKTKR